MGRVLYFLETFFSEMTIAEVGMCMCACGESVGFVFKILNLLFALSPTELAAQIASGAPISVQS